jgi:hypothetical protein
VGLQFSGRLLAKLAVCEAAGSSMFYSRLLPSCEHSREPLKMTPPRHAKIGTEIILRLDLSPILVGVCYLIGTGCRS